MASWISFWLDVDAVPARVTLGVTTLLTTTAQHKTIKDDLPPVSYTKVTYYSNSLNSFLNYERNEFFRRLMFGRARAHSLSSVLWWNLQS